QVSRYSARLPVVSLPLARVIGPRSSKSSAEASPPPPPPASSDPPPQAASAAAAVVTPPAARTVRRDANWREVLLTMSKLLCSDASTDVLDLTSVRAREGCRGPDPASTTPPPHSASPAGPPSGAAVSARPIDWTHERHRRPPRRCRAPARPPGLHRARSVDRTRPALGRDLARPHRRPVHRDRSPRDGLARRLRGLALGAARRGVRRAPRDIARRRLGRADAGARRCGRRLHRLPARAAPCADPARARGRGPRPGGEGLHAEHGPGARSAGPRPRAR